MKNEYTYTADLIRKAALLEAVTTAIATEQTTNSAVATVRAVERGLQELVEQLLRVESYDRSDVLSALADAFLHVNSDSTATNEATTSTSSGGLGYPYLLDGGEGA